MRENAREGPTRTPDRESSARRTREAADCRAGKVPRPWCFAGEDPDVAYVVLSVINPYCASADRRLASAVLPAFEPVTVGFAIAAAPLNPKPVFVTCNEFRVGLPRSSQKLTTKDVLALRSLIHCEPLA